MNREDALSDARDIMTANSGMFRIWPLSNEIALRTSLNQDEAFDGLYEGITRLVADMLETNGETNGGTNGH